MMNKLIVLLSILALSGQMAAQVGTLDTYRALNIRIGVSGPTTPGTDSTWTLEATILSDQLGQGYNGTQIAVGDRIVDQLGGWFQITSFNSPSSSGAIDVEVVEVLPTTLGPTGIGVVYDNQVGDLSLLVPENSRGITSATLARILNHNFIKLAGSVGADGYDPNRPILRVASPGDTVTSHEWFYFAAPTMSNISFSPTPTVYEVGTSTAITISGSTNNPASATLSGGILETLLPSTGTINSFGASDTYSQPITFSPQQGGSGNYNEVGTYRFRASQNYTGAESGSAVSNNKDLVSVYPVLYGMGSTDTASVMNNAYTTLSKDIVEEGDNQVTLNGTGLIYYGFPASWTDTNLSQIEDHNPFDVTSSFDRICCHNVSSTGLTNNWTNVPYVFYVLNTGSTTTSNYTYSFNQ